MLSGIQHIAFCERQYAIAYIEMQWSENRLTVEGQHLHERVDDPYSYDSRGPVITLRSVSLLSRKLGLTGIADVVELIRSSENEGIELPEREGLWKPRPVEYKRGKPKPDYRDQVQVCAQAMCLEEMYSIQIQNGSLFYGETRHREMVVFSEDLRNRVYELASRMHVLFEKGQTPLPIYKSHCKSCSLMDICLPQSIQRMTDVNTFLTNELMIHE